MFIFQGVGRELQRARGPISVLTMSLVREALLRSKYHSDKPSGSRQGGQVGRRVGPSSRAWGLGKAW